MMRIVRLLRPIATLACPVRRFANIYTNISDKLKKKKLVITQVRQTDWRFANVRSFTRAQYTQAVDSLTEETANFRDSPFIILDVRDPDENRFDELPPINSVFRPMFYHRA